MVIVGCIPYGEVPGDGVADGDRGGGEHKNLTKETNALRAAGVKNLQHLRKLHCNTQQILSSIIHVEEEEDTMCYKKYDPIQKVAE